MANSSIINKIFAISPQIEIVIRKIYWNNINFFQERNAKKIKNGKYQNELKDFDKVTQYLANEGIGKGDLMILHSSYESLGNTKLTPNQIIQKLIDFLGDNGTLAMNSGRRFKEEKDTKYYLKENYEDIICTYDLRKSKVWTGVLPFYMLRNPNSEISEFPINSMVAVGRLAKKMMINNLKGNLTSCGSGSSWEFCADNDAVIVGLGIDLTHSLTMIHVAEDTKNDKWPVKDWYRNRKYLIVNGSERKEITVKERKPKWGALHFAERTLCEDLIKNNLLISTNIDGVQVEYIYAKKLINFLDSKNSKGYPYFQISKNSRT